MRIRFPSYPAQAAIFPLLCLLALARPADAQTGCPGGSGTPITISNLKAGETLGYDLALVKGTVGAGAQQVSLTVGGEATAWPVAGTLFKGFLRLKPGANRIVVSAAGNQNACVDVTYASNPFGNQIQLAVIVPKDYIEGGPIFVGPAGEPADLASAKKRIAMAGLLQQSLIGELLGKAGKAHLAPYIVRDAQGEPDVLILNSDKTKAELEASQSAPAYTYAQSALKGKQDGRTRFETFYAIIPGVFHLTDGTLSGMDRMYAWPQELSELVSRFTDRRSPKDLAVPGATTDTIGLARYLKSDYGFWFKLAGLWALDVPNVDTVTADPFGKSSDKLNTLFMTKTETGTDILTEPYSLGAITTNGLIASAWLANPNPARLPPVYAPPGLVQGVAFRYYEGSFDKLPDFTALTPVASGVAAEFSIAQRTSDENFAFVFDAYLKVSEGGPCLFQLLSDDGSRLLIDGKTVVDNDGIHADGRVSKGTALDVGTHRIQIQYFNKAGDRGLTVKWANASTPLQPIAAAALQREPVQVSLRYPANAANVRVHRVGDVFELNLTEARHVSLEFVSPGGRWLGNWFSGYLSAGEHRLPAPTGVDAERILILRE